MSQIQMVEENRHSRWPYVLNKHYGRTHTHTHTHAGEKESGENEGPNTRRHYRDLHTSLGETTAQCISYILHASAHFWGAGVPQLGCPSYTFRHAGNSSRQHCRTASHHLAPTTLQRNATWPSLPTGHLPLATAHPTAVSLRP